MSIKKKSNDVIDMSKVLRDDQSLRTSIENMNLEDNQDEKEYVRRDQYHLVRGKINPSSSQ